MPLAPDTRLGPYRIVEPLGAGGMGEVYRARDDRLGRDVAIKVLSAEMSSDPGRRQRLEREARVIAGLNHPHVCALYDVGTQDDIDYLVMELLEGESLAERLSRGPLPFEEAARLGTTIAETLAAVHDQGIVHRDLKPANVFLARHGVKLLDFGIARLLDSGAAAETALTQDGMVLGTPRYLAPEQLRGGVVDHRTDLFAAAVLIYEMIAGRPAFGGTSVVEVLHAIAYEPPAPLPDHAAPPAFEQVLRQALEKDPARRPQTAAALSAALRHASDTSAVATVGASSAPRPPTRLIVLPFRLLRADPETDFLGFSLADAVSAALAGLDALVVRSSLTATQFAGGMPDPRTLAEQAQVDVALTGSLLRVGSQLRMSAQLVEVPGGTLIWSHTLHASVDDLFQLQDTLTQAIVSSLQVPLTVRDHHALRQDVPASAAAYELYLRGNQLMIESSAWGDAQQLYEQALALDPGYAPAWARLGRVLRLMGKYSGRPDEQQRAARAFERALALNPDLAMAHQLYAHLEVETGRATEAMVRLLVRARTRPRDPELFAGLVTTCRYGGLLDASLAAYTQAHRLDPAVQTSVAYTFYQCGQYARVVETDHGSPAFAAPLARFRLGEGEPLLDFLRTLEQGIAHQNARLVVTTYRFAMERRAGELPPLMAAMDASGFRDPEGFFLIASYLAYAGALDESIDALGRAVRGGFHCPSAMRGDALWDPVRTRPEFQHLLSQAESASQQARDAFAQAGGEDVLPPAP
jgi:serine/threonine protein kinase